MEIDPVDQMSLSCPLCKIDLVRWSYEGLNINQCGSCRGVLVVEGRLGGIQAKRERSRAQLETELGETRGRDTRKIVHCPECSSAMEKRIVKRPHSFAIDCCDDCGLVWLDGGELAALQLAYEASGRGRESRELKRRMDEMSPERRTEFEQNIAKLPDPPNPVIEGILDAIHAALRHGPRPYDCDIKYGKD